MKSLAAIVQLTLRAALRERVAWSMLVLVAGTLLLLPLGLRGDGTLAGELRMHIRYSTGISVALLAAMTLWVSCASIAGDLSSKRLQMVLSKPVSRLTLWWGKWIAVSLLSCTLLMICGGVTRMRVLRRVNGAGLGETARAELERTLLAARRPARPRIEGLDEQVLALYKEALLGGSVPAGVPKEEILREMRNFALTMRFAANQDQILSWEIPLTRPVSPEDVLQLGFIFDGGSMGSALIPGEWILGTAENPDLHRVRIDLTPSGEHVLDLPRIPELTGAKTLSLSFHNQAEDRQMVFFRPRDGVVIYRLEGSFGPNLFRALALLAGLLCLLAALGVSAGSLFSLPVACYATAMILVVQLFSGTLDRVLEDGTTLSPLGEHSAWAQSLDRAAMTAYRGMHAVLRPLDVGQPLDRVSRGVLVAPGEVGRTLLLRMTPVLALLSLSGIYLFQKREVGGAE